ncbi:MAG: nitroreductase family protein [Syntrophorhabdaceae bacterium]|nr:nitroreductase family protein [Syntrophorhabdaceae bacterium]
MTILELVTKSRSCRRFQEKEAVSLQQLKALVELARLSPSARNLQPLRFILSRDPGSNAGIFSCLAWAGYLRDWPGPGEGERPAAYIIIVGDTSLTNDFGCDHGIAAQSILLGATEMGLGGCMLSNIQKDRLSALLKIPQQYQVLLAIALGVPKEQVVIDKVKNGDIKYWRDSDQVHHVPKRALAEIILKI